VPVEHELEPDLQDLLHARPRVGVRERGARRLELREEAAGDRHVESPLVRGERLGAVARAGSWGGTWCGRRVGMERFIQVNRGRWARRGLAVPARDPGPDPDPDPNPGADPGPGTDQRRLRREQPPR
jgi:hypothetical protein